MAFMCLKGFRFKKYAKFDGIARIGLVDQDACTRMVGQSSVIERSFQQMRGAEKNSPNSSIGNHAKYDVLASSSRLRDEHRYTLLDPSMCDVPRGVGATRLPDKMFKLGARDTSLSLDGLVSHQQTPTWYSPGAAQQGQRHADLYLVRECEAQNKLGDMRMSWLCTLAVAPRLILRRKTWPEHTWRFSLGDAFGSVVLTCHVGECGGLHASAEYASS